MLLAVISNKIEALRLPEAKCDNFSLERKESGEANIYAKVAKFFSLMEAESLTVTQTTLGLMASSFVGDRGRCVLIERLFEATTLSSPSCQFLLDKSHFDHTKIMSTLANGPPNRSFKRT